MRSLTVDEVLGPCDLVANLSGCCAGSDAEPALLNLEPDQQSVVLDMAATTLRLLTAGAVANCPVVARPCRATSCASAGWTYDSGTWKPHIDELGSWVNVCDCGTHCACRPEGIRLGSVAEVLEVVIDGVALGEGSYALLGDTLMRTDGEAWPKLQDMSKIDGPGTFLIRYRPGRPLGLLGEVALGTLACEYAKALCGTKCALPKGVTEIVRNGVSMTIAPGLFPDGMTGIRSVDLYVESVNPLRVKVQSGIYVPEMRNRGVFG